MPKRLTKGQRPPFEAVSEKQLVAIDGDLRAIEARVSKDGTHWCLACPTPIEATAAARLCQGHAKMRSEARRKRNRAVAKRAARDGQPRKRPTGLVPLVGASPQNDPDLVMAVSRLSAAVRNARAAEQGRTQGLIEARGGVVDAAEVVRREIGRVLGI